MVDNDNTAYKELKTSLQISELMRKRLEFDCFGSEATYFERAMQQLGFVEPKPPDDHTVVNIPITSSNEVIPTDDDENDALDGIGATSDELEARPNFDKRDVISTPEAPAAPPAPDD
jgi:hypothetical protein